MAKNILDVHAGDFKKGKRHKFEFNRFYMVSSGKLFTEKIKSSAVEEVSIATEENVKKIGGAVGWGIAGGVLLGPVGLLAGLLAGGKKKQVTFVCKFKDGRKFLATAPSKVYTEISASVF